MLDRSPLQDMEAAWTLAIDSDRGATATSVAHLDSHTIVAGSFSGPLPLGTRPLQAARPGDGFVARMDQAGQVVWVKLLGGPGHDAVTALRVSPSGTASMAGSFESSINIGTSMIRASGTHSGFVVRFAM